MTESLGEQFKRDPRVQEAKKLLTEAMEEHQKGIVSVKPPVEELKVSYDQMLTEIGKRRGRPLFCPYLSSGLGKGVLVELADGSVKYDFITGIGAHYMGHNHPKLLESGVDAAIEDTVMQGNLQQGVKSLELFRRFVNIACRKGADLQHSFLTSSGAMANENAFKIIFQKNSPAPRLLAFERCFSGRSMAAAQMTYKSEIRQGLPKVLDIDYIPFFDADDPEGSTERSVRHLKEYLARHPNEYAGMCFELIQGEGGYYPGDRDFFIALMNILKENNVAVMVDEIQTFGRTTEFFAFQYFGLDSYVDVVTVGKMSQVCATLFTPAFNPQPGLLSQTFTSSSAAIYASCVILEELENGGYLGEDGKITRYSKYFVERLKALGTQYPQKLRGPFGLGAMVGCTVFNGDFEKTKAFLTALYEAGVMAFIAGKNPSRVRFLMPIGAVTEGDIEGVCGIMEEVLKSKMNNK